MKDIFSRRQFCLLFIAAPFLFVEGCMGNESKTELSFSPELLAAFGQQGVDIISKAVNQYIGAYGCPVTKIAIGVVNPQTKDKIDIGGRTAEIFELSGPSSINFDPTTIKDVPDYELQSMLKGIAEHATTHACQSSEKRLLDQPIPINGGMTVFAFEGFKLYIHQINPAGNDVIFSLIEEAIAELLARKIDPSYVYSDVYKNIAELAKYAIDQGWATDQQIASLLQQSDFNGYVSIVTGNSNPTSDDYKNVIAWYQQAFKGKDLSGIEAEMKSSRKNGNG